MNDNATNGKTLRRFRLLCDLTIDELARRAECDPSAISRYERGLRRPTSRTLDRVLAVLFAEQARVTANTTEAGR